MADYKALKPFILKWEGGYSNRRNDRGGATNRGVTLATFRQYYGQGKTVEELKRLTDQQWEHIFKTGYWDKWLGDQIENQSVANICVDWAWASGTGTAIRKVQSVVGVKEDGIVGQQTLSAINKANQRHLFNKIKSARLQFVEGIVRRDPTQKENLKGWRNRIAALEYTDK